MQPLQKKNNIQQFCCISKTNMVYSFGENPPFIVQIWFYIFIVESYRFLFKSWSENTHKRHSAIPKETIRYIKSEEQGQNQHQEQTHRTSPLDSPHCHCFLPVLTSVVLLFDSNSSYLSMGGKKIKLMEQLGLSTRELVGVVLHCFSPRGNCQLFVN